MGAIADAMARYAQPLIDGSDGSPEQLQRALMLSQLCWNLALVPEENRGELLAKMQLGLKMEDDEFQELKRDVVIPMIQRHQQMFPALQRANPEPFSQRAAARSMPQPAPRIHVTKKYPGTGRNAPCPCGSGRKYKLCCGR